MPDIENFGDYYGKAVFTCPSCDGYEVQGRAVAVIGDGHQIAGLALSPHVALLAGTGRDGVRRRPDLMLSAPGKGAP